MKKIFLAATLACSMTAFSKDQHLSEAVRNEFSNSFYAEFSGKVFTRMTSSKSLLILINTTGEEAYDKSLVLTSQLPARFVDITKDEMDIFIVLSQKTVIFVDNAAEIITVIGLNNDETQGIVTRLKANSSTSPYISDNNFLAYGLSYLNGSWALEKIAASKYKSPFNALANGDRTGRMMLVVEEESGDNMCSIGKCTSGGAGSNSCQITEDLGPIRQTCNVTCNVGYYACCDSKTLRCYCCKINAVN